MPDLIPKERLQPALLDRLEDDRPDTTEESRNKRVISPRELHECVKRDLAWLLNAPNLETTDDLEDYPEVKNSVLNYGVPDFSGRTMRDADIPEVQRQIRQAVLSFEPRIIAKTLEVEIRIQKDEMSHNQLTFFIHGDLWADPMPLELYLRTEMDLENGSVVIEDAER